MKVYAGAEWNDDKTGFVLSQDLDFLNASLASKEDYQKQLSDIKERHDFIDKIHDKLNTLRVEQLKETFDFISKY